MRLMAWGKSKWEAWYLKFGDSEGEWDPLNQPKGRRENSGKLGALRLATAQIAHVVLFAPPERRWRNGTAGLVVLLIVT